MGGAIESIIKSVERVARQFFQDRRCTGGFLPVEVATIVNIVVSNRAVAHASHDFVG